jgi:hypothetical protein
MRASRTFWLGGALALLAVIDAPASAQDSSGTCPAASGSVLSDATLRSGEGTSQPAPKRSQLASVLGGEVRTRVEEDVGRIIDLLADRQGCIRAAVIEFGGFMGIGTRKIAVEWSALKFEYVGGKPVAKVDLTRDQLRIAPEFKPEEPVVVGGASG